MFELLKVGIIEFRVIEVFHKNLLGNFKERVEFHLNLGKLNFADSKLRRVDCTYLVKHPCNGCF